ncbi:MAG: septum formation protein Maf [Rhodobacteraceae bacterium]|nr:septum formation protein Maf [Paracoccaceae bacterium]
MLTVENPLLLASGSEIRAGLLRNAGVPFKTMPARIDEEALRQSLRAEGATPRDLSDALAEAKARKVSASHPESLTLGCDQILSCDGEVLDKPDNQDSAIRTLSALSGRTHHLFSAAVAYQHGKPIWRHIGHVRLTMVELPPDYIRSYVSTYWDEIRHCVGCYRLEAEGVRLISHIDGDYFHVLGLPLTELLTWLRLRGDITP